MKTPIQIYILAILSNIAFAQSYVIHPNRTILTNSNTFEPLIINMKAGFSGTIDFMRGNVLSAGIRNSLNIKQLRFGIGDINLPENADIVIDSATRFIGIRTVNPLAQLHVNAGTSGVTPNSAPAVFIEDNRNTYFNLAAPNANETGILFGRPDDTGTSGGIIYRSNKDMHLRTNGNVTRMTISSAGDVGIGTTTPAHKLDVFGNVNTSTGYTVNGSPIAGYYFNTNWTTITASSVDSTFDATCIKAKRIMIPELTADVIANGEISVLIRTSSSDTKALRLPYISEAGGATNQISAFAKKTGEIIVYRHTFKSCRFNSGVPESYTGEPVMVNLGSSLEYRVVIIKK